MQAQASQVANQVASQIALSAQVAKAAHAAQAQAHVAQASTQPFNNHALMNQQPVFPHPIPIAPVNAPTPAPAGVGTPGPNKPSFNRMMSSAKENGVAASTSFSPQAGSPPPISLPDFHRAYDITSHLLHHHTVSYNNIHIFPFSRKRSPSNDASDSLSGEPAQKMVQVNGAAMVPAELTNQRVSPIINTAPAAPVLPPPIMKPNTDFKLEGLPEINEDNEEFLAFLA